MKRVLNIVPYPFLPFFSGGQKLIAQFNEYLGEQCVLHVASTADNDAQLADTYTFHPVLKKSRFRYADIGSFFRTRRLIRQEQIDTVIIEHPYLGWLGWMLKKSCSIRLIVHTHNVEYERFRTIGKIWWPLLKWYEGFVLRSADCVLCISEEDEKQMIENLQIDQGKCVIVPYGINRQEHPSDKRKCKELVCSKHGLNPQHTLLLFNGLLDYKPNFDALIIILKKINPLLLQSSLRYNILITGKHLPNELNQLKEWENQNVHYAGFVEDIEVYFRAADIFLNPVQTGGGVKTKMIEALGSNTPVVATETGAIGVNKIVCGRSLIIIQDGDWHEFAKAIIGMEMENHSIPRAFYETYYWGNILKKTLERLRNL